MECILPWLPNSAGPDSNRLIGILYQGSLVACLHNCHPAFVSCNKTNSYIATYVFVEWRVYSSVVECYIKELASNSPCMHACTTT